MVGSSVGLGGAVVVLVQGFWVCKVCIWVYWILGLMLCSGAGDVLILDLMFFLGLVFGVALWFGEFWCLVFGLQVCGLLLRFRGCTMVAVGCGWWVGLLAYCSPGLFRIVGMLALAALRVWLLADLF